MIAIRFISLIIMVPFSFLIQILLSCVSLSFIREGRNLKIEIGWSRLSFGDVERFHERSRGGRGIKISQRFTIVE